MDAVVFNPNNLFLFLQPIAIQSNLMPLKAYSGNLKRLPEKLSTPTFRLDFAYWAEKEFFHICAFKKAHNING